MCSLQTISMLSHYNELILPATGLLCLTWRYNIWLLDQESINFSWIESLVPKANPIAITKTS